MLQNDLKKQTMSTKSKNSISVKSAAKKEQFETKDSGKSKIADS